MLTVVWFGFFYIPTLCGFALYEAVWRFTLVSESETPAGHECRPGAAALAAAALAPTTRPNKGSQGLTWPSRNHSRGGAANLTKKVQY